MPRAKEWPKLTEEQQALAASCFYLAVREATRCHRRTGLELDELVSLAQLQLVRLASWFDPSKGYPFPPIAARCVAQFLNGHCQKQLRRPKAFPVSQLGDEDEPFPFDPAAPAESGYDLGGRLTAAAMKALTPVERAVIRMRYVERMKIRQIAKRLGVSNQRAQQRLAEAKERLSRSHAVRKIAREAGVLP